MVELWYAIVALHARPPTSCSTASTSAPARSTCSSRGPTPSGGRCSAAIGPFWDGNEVWLLAAGGALFVGVPARAGRRALGLLLRDLPGAVVPDPARHLDRVPQPRRRPAVARVLGRRLLRWRARCSPVLLRRRARQPAPRRAARRRRLVRARALHRLHGARRRSASSTGTRCWSASSRCVALAGARRARSWPGRPTAPVQRAQPRALARRALRARSPCSGRS